MIGNPEGLNLSDMHDPQPGLWDPIEPADLQEAERNDALEREQRNYTAEEWDALHGPAVPFQASSDESRQAARALTPRITPRRIAMLREYDAAGWHGLSDRQLAARLQTEPGSVTGNRHALVNLGYVAKDDALWRWNQLHEGKVGVYVLTNEGRAALRRLGQPPTGELPVTRHRSVARPSPATSTVG